MNYFIGIDGGGTKTKIICTDNNLKTFSSLKSNATNPLVVGFNSSSEILTDLFTRVSKKKQISYCVMGIAGCGNKSNADLLKKCILKRAKKINVILPPIEIVSDAEIALEAAFEGKQGILLIAGTGSVLFGKTAQEEKFKIGGFGRIIGDGGSGYSIGSKGLDAAAKSIDSRLGETLLLSYLEKNFKIKTRDELITSVYSNNLDIASFAPHVIKAAEKNDKTAQRIINDEVNELLLLINASLKFLKNNKTPLCLSGGLLSTKNYYSKLVRQRIKNDYKEIKLVKAKYPPEIGAVILAKSLFEKNSTNKME